MAREPGLNHELVLIDQSQLRQRRPPRLLHHFVRHPAEEKRIGLVEVPGVVTMHLFVRNDRMVIAAPVQCDVLMEYRRGRISQEYRRCRHLTRSWPVAAGA
ncbi:hypothetical protein ACFQ10_01560 [Streptomyces indonesiensis]